MKKEKVSFFKLPSTRILIRFIIIAFITVLAVIMVLPTLLNYPPNSINTDFDIEMSGIPFAAQFLAIFIVAAIAITLLVKILFKPIDNWYKNPDSKKYNDYKQVNIIRKKCFSLPYILFLVELIIPIAGIVLVLTLTGSHHPIMIFKIILLLFSFLLFFSATSYIFSKSLYLQILRNTYNEKYTMGIRVSLKNKILLQILPISIMGILLTSLIAYTQVIKAKEDALFETYTRNLENYFNTSKVYNSAELIKNFSEFELCHYSHSKFIIYPDGSYLTLKGFDPSDFMIRYTIELAEGNNGRTYDGYGIDTQGASIKINTDDGVYTLVVSYSVDSTETLLFLLIDFLFVIFITLLFLEMFASSLQKDITTVSDSLENIADSSTGMSKLPIISNDEFGDLAIAYNKVQAMSENHLKQIKNNQDLLIERERLASLGQMVGGIAHNLKTPIMSISGASEGLNQLVTELENSLGNPIVTEDDYRDIAKDMKEWIEKIKTHTSYMSDVITVVKGQTVTFSDSQVFSFTVDTLFKQVDILMKHELKSALITLRVVNNVDNSHKIVGNINSLVQILNNIISNAIQAYNGKSDEFIDLSANLRDNTTIEIVVRDYGPGLPDIVKKNLFKQMVTTKGKSGTGLGMFMSYSNIKAHFKGDITFETEKNKGTAFIITIPINNNEEV
ncbi:MAG: HAMP domain-containing histidine kinase [Clostridia bacterium]|nr:HAMP domain-containing histidine kinase [Clostridia bacterium]